MHQMTIMQILPTLHQGGVERGTIEIAAALKQAGIPNIVVSAGGPMTVDLHRLGVEHITLQVETKNPFKMWLNAYRLARIVREKNVGLMHVRSRAPAFSVKWASQKTHVPFIATYHGVYGIHPAWFKKWYNRIMLQGRVVIAISDYVRQHLMTEYHVPAERIRLIYRGADTMKFSPDAAPMDKVLALATEKQIPLDKPIILCVGRLSSTKGQKVLLQALRQMKNKEVTCLLVGGKAKPEYMKELEVEVAKLSDQTSVQTFSVTPDQVPLVDALCNIFVSLRQTPEAFGRTLVEAQAMGKVVVSTALGGPLETIEDGRTGFLVPPNNSRAVAKALDHILDLSKAEREQIESAAMTSVREKFSIQKMCADTIALYKEVLNDVKKEKNT